MASPVVYFVREANAYLSLPSIRVCGTLGLWTPSAGGWIVTTAVATTG
jgi:hypothetical protein